MQDSAAEQFKITSDVLKLLFSSHVKAEEEGKKWSRESPDPNAEP